MTYGIVISSYKYGHLAAHAVESVLSQNVKFNKIFFVDDGVGDCQHIKSLYGDRLEFILNPQNLGTVDNFNQMLNMVDTDYVMFLGADNWLRSDTLELLSYQMDKIPVDIITYDIMVTGELKDEIHRFYSSFMKTEHGDWYWNRKGAHHGSMMYRVELAKSVGGYAHNKTSGRTDEDLNLWDKMQKSGAKVHHISESLLYYRRHKENFNKY
jgi:glycosyltransferase involved in cell wall biosynthesis